jgi:hypothetical protein
MASSNAAEFVVALCFVALGCKSRDQRARVAARDAPTHAEVDPDQDDDEDDDRDNYWRAQIAIVGRGAVKTTVEAFDCMRDSRDPPRGECGPKLVRFKELSPPLMRAIAARGSSFHHWEAIVHEPDGTTRARIGPLPDGPVYIDGFGYRDTGELETVTAVFVDTPNR